MDHLDIIASFRMCCAAEISIAHGFVRSRSYYYVHGVYAYCMYMALMLIW